MKRRNPLTQVGMLIKLELVRQEKTATELAKEIGVSKSTISDVLTGYNKSRKTQALIFNRLGIEERQDFIA